MPTKYAAERRSVARVGPVAVGCVLILLGTPLLGLGFWVAMLGGGYYYLVSGAGLIVSGALLIRWHLEQHRWLLVLIGIVLCWVAFDVDFDGQAVLQRIAGPAFFVATLLAIALVILRNGQTRRR